MLEEDRKETHSVKLKLQAPQSPVLPGMSRIWECLRLAFDSTGPIIFAQKCAGPAHSSNQADERSGGKYSQSKMHLNFDTFYFQFVPAALAQQTYM